MITPKLSAWSKSGTSPWRKFDLSTEPYKRQKGTPLYAQHNRTRLDLVAERKAQTKALETQLRDEYFDNVHTKSLPQQLDETLRDFEPKTHQEDSRKYTFSERARVSKCVLPLKNPLATQIYWLAVSILYRTWSLYAQSKSFPKDHLNWQKDKPNSPENKIVIDPVLFTLKLS